MTCGQCGRTVTRIRCVVVDGKMVEGCITCMAGTNPSTISTEKRLYEGPGYSFTASPAHIDHIRHRRVASDGRTVEQNRR